MLVSESSAMHQLRRRSAQKPQLDLITPLLSISCRQVQPAVAPKAHDHRGCGVSFGPWPSSTMASVRRGSRCSRGGILKHRRTNLPSTTDEGIYNCKIAPKFSGAVNSYSPSA